MVVAALLGGCGGGGGDGTKSGVPAVRQCLADDPRYEEVEPLDADERNSAALDAEQRVAIDRATAASAGALVAKAGGPQERDGTITEIPLSKTRLYFFADAAAAQRAAASIEPVVGAPDEAVLNGVRAVGRVTVVHYSFGIGDEPGGVPLEGAGLAAVERCVREGGFG